MKLWEKGTNPEKTVENFTTSTDRITDMKLAAYDVIGSMAHAKMLHSINLLSYQELEKLQNELLKIYQQIKSGNFAIEDNVEDIHSQVEIMLTKEIGDAGKKLHTARSRNDQVLLDMRLFFRDALEHTVELTNNLFETLLTLSNKHKDVFMPGYTHMQAAMPSSFGLWFGAYAESLIDDIQLLLAAYKINNQNPLGSAAGYGSSFPISRTLTTEFLGFENIQVNVVYSQMSRQKNEKNIAYAISSVASTISRMAMDICLYSGQNFGFFTLPEQFTTGSSIMPHKHNPDPFELIRAKCNKINSLPNEITILSMNLPLGYHRDYQESKPSIINAFEVLNESISMAILLLNNLNINTTLLDNPLYEIIFSVEEVNKLVLEGIPFRDAYRKVADNIKTGNYKTDKNTNHTHEGSMGNLCNDIIENRMKKLLADFNFKKHHEAIHKLLEEK